MEGSKGSLCLTAFSAIPVEMPAGEMAALEPEGKSRARHRGQPRPKVGKQMRMIAAPPRGLLAPGRASTANATASQALDVPKAAASASETKVEVRGAYAQLTALAHRQSAVCVQTLGMPAVKMSDPVPPAAPPSLHGSYRSHRRRAASSCGSFDSASGPATVRSLKSQKKHGEGRRTASDLQLSHLVPYAPKAGELLLFSVITLLPFILLGLSLVPMLFAEEACGSDNSVPTLGLA
jgi:hypothetical protein